MLEDSMTTNEARHDPVQISAGDSSPQLASPDSSLITHHSSLRSRAYAGETDVPTISALILAADAVDRLDQGLSPDELRMHLTEPGVDAARDVRLWMADDGALVAFAHLLLRPDDEIIDGYLRFDWHPDWRTDALADAILAWATARLREVAADRGKAARLRSWMREEDTNRRRQLERHGLTIVRHFPTLERPLTEPIDAPELPEGFSIRPLAGPDEVAAWVEMHNESFVDHYNFHPESPEVIHHWLDDPIYRPELNLVAVAPDGRLVGFCWCAIFAEENARTGRNEGWIELLGTRRGYRRMGLGRALVLSGLLVLRQAGLDAARLGVDADSPTGATRLYAATGFRHIHTYLTYVKELET
jgi:mycothiol synthase